MNVSRGVFRLWSVLTALWVAGVAIAGIDLTLDSMNRQSRYEECRQILQPFELSPMASALLPGQQAAQSVLGDMQSWTPWQRRMIAYAGLRMTDADAQIGQTGHDVEEWTQLPDGGPAGSPWLNYVETADERLLDDFEFFPDTLESALERRVLAAYREGNRDAARVWEHELRRLRQTTAAVPACLNSYPGRPLRTAFALVGFGAGVPALLFLLGWASIWVGRGFRD
tara:strand:+ start:268 stop:945 length:678 start_codon:yes stop_codon:yes gene_type:complete